MLPDLGPRLRIFLFVFLTPYDFPSPLAGFCRRVTPLFFALRFTAHHPCFAFSFQPLALCLSPSFSQSYVFTLIP